ncbi:LolA family protein [Marilutibacter chinensis]|uniref:Outer membrane lipoprotein-sorting protein n=1 Tax=Marilutibacter chinensis TaxID=2912247 RepID=A0ABS9HRG7_9GAMM|nr:hypothetical protein [Lysobacter chinensis]MCF7221526.1 hypothetical protein [Lysobacter chinensis]
MSNPHSMLSKLLIAAAMLGPATALADPRDELHAAYGKFLDADRFRATVSDASDGSQLTEMEFVAPDRYRIRLPGGPSQLVIGNTLYMEMDGRTMKLPMPAGDLTRQYRDRDALKEQDLAVEALGGDSVDGEPAQVYRYTTTRHGKADVRTWISEHSGLPLQIETTGGSGDRQRTVRIRYRDFDDPSIRIDAPR